MPNPISKWINDLRGKPKGSAQNVKQPANPVPNKTEPASLTEIKPPVEAEEDSVAADIKNLKAFTKKIVGKTSTIIKPYEQKGGSVSSSALSKAGGLVDKSFLRKIVRVFLILLFLLILVFVAIRLFKSTSENGGVPGFGNQPTPTSYQPYIPSLYVEDPEIRQLEEDVNVLAGEISGTNIRELDLNPPVLDFNISF